MEEMEKVYVVTDGEYSDFHIEAIFSTREKAEAFLNSRKKNVYDDWALHEYPLDYPDFIANKIANGYKLFKVVMDRGGNTISIGEGNITSLENEFQDGFGWGSKIGEFSTTVFAHDEQHAVKIANERRVQLIASGEW